MTQEELLSEKIFIDLFNKNQFERIKEENKLFLEAKNEMINKNLDSVEKSIDHHL